LLVAAELSLCLCAVLGPLPSSFTGGSSKAKAAAKAATKQDKRNARLKEQRAAGAAAGGKKAPPALQSETEQFNKAIRGVKSRARALMQEGMTAKAAQKAAQKIVTGGKWCSARRHTGGQGCTGKSVATRLVVWLRASLTAVACSLCCTRLWHRCEHDAPEEEAQDG
jgi:hypothetical protein